MQARSCGNGVVLSPHIEREGCEEIKCEAKYSRNPSRNGNAAGPALAQQRIITYEASIRYCGAFDLDGSASLRKSSDRALLISGLSALQNLRRLTPSLDKRRTNARETCMIYHPHCLSPVNSIR